MSTEEFNKFYEICLSQESLKNHTFRESLQESFNSEEVFSSPEDTAKFEFELATKYHELNKFKTYHIANLTTSLDNIKLEEIKAQLQQKTPQILVKPYITKGMYEVSSNVKGSILSFGILAFKNKIKSLKDEETRLTVGEERYKVLYMFQVDIVAISDEKQIVVISLPTYCERTGSLYYFNEEIKYVYSFLEGLGHSLEPFMLRDFFNSISAEHETIEPKGFHGKSFISKNGDIPIEITHKRSKVDPEQHQDFFDTIDEIVSEDIINLLSSSLVEQGLVDKKKTDPLAKSLRTSLNEYGLSESVIAEIKLFSKDGAGWIRYKDSSRKVKDYTLHYNKKNQAQVRARIEGWSTFEPIFDEIQKFIN